jgi:hypothetical protein
MGSERIDGSERLKTVKYCSGYGERIDPIKNKSTISRKSKGV